MGNIGDAPMRYDEVDRYDNLRLMGWLFFVVSPIAGIIDYIDNGGSIGGQTILGAILFAVGCVMIWKFRNPNGENLWEKVKY